MLDPDIAAAFGEPASLPRLDAGVVTQLRAGMAEIGRTLPAIDLPDVRDMVADGVPVRLYRPAGDAPLPLLVFLHGGGWMLGDLDTHDAMHRILADRAGCAVLAVGYRLAPEQPFPAGLEDCHAALAWARREAPALGCDPNRIALGGESAGANLAAALTLDLRAGGEAQPLFQLLVHPVTDFNFAHPSIDTVQAAGLTRAFLEDARTLYAAGHDYRGSRMSPLHAADHAGLPSAIVLTAAEDPLRDDGEAYAAALARAGVETLVSRLPGLPHGFLFLPATIPAVSRSFDLIARLIRRYFA